MDVGGTPGVGMILPGIGAGLDSGEAVAALRVGDDTAGPGKVRVDRRRMLVDDMDVAARGVRLPDFEERVRNRPAVLVEHASGHDDALAERLAGVLAREVGVVLAHALMPIDRAGELG